VRVLLEDPKKEVLLLIDNFAKKLAHILWKKYRAIGTIPLFISLLTIKDLINNLIPEYLKEKEISEKDIQSSQGKLTFCLYIRQLR